MPKKAYICTMANNEQDMETPAGLKGTGDGKSVLIVGAGGFVGGYLARMALDCGYNTYVGVRASTSRRYLDDPRLHFVVLDYDDAEAEKRQLTQAAPSPAGWDCIVWNLGATKCADMDDFDRINYGYLRRFADVLQDTGLIPGRFLYMSSLSVLGLGDEKTFAPFTSQSVPNPNTAYGRSKLKSEVFLEKYSRLPWIIFRPTGIYGPHEKDYMMMVESIDRHLDVSVGFTEQQLSFLYVADLVTAVFQALAAPADKVLGHKYILTDGGSWTQKQFRQLTLKYLNKGWALPLRLPMWAVYCVSVAAEKAAAMRGKASTLNRDKFKIMRQRNWNCDITDARRDFGYTPAWPLPRGLAATVAAYLAARHAK